LYENQQKAVILSSPDPHQEVCPGLCWCPQVTDSIQNKNTLLV